MKQLPEVFYKNDVLKNFTKFPENRLCQSLYFHKVEYLRPATLLKKRLWQECFPVNCGKFLRTYFHRIPPDDCFLNPTKFHNGSRSIFRATILTPVEFQMLKFWLFTFLGGVNHRAAAFKGCFYNLINFVSDSLFLQKQSSKGIMKNSSTRTNFTVKQSLWSFS